MDNKGILEIKKYIEGCTNDGLDYVQKYIDSQREKLNAKPKLPKIRVLYFDDGCEGFYVKESRLKEIKPEQFYNFMVQTIEQGSELLITVVDEYDEVEFLEQCARYSWFDDEQEEWIKFRDKDDND
jgi:capsule polysaccharide export protein KpsE/RkpR